MNNLKWKVLSGIVLIGLAAFAYIEIEKFRIPELLRDSRNEQVNSLRFDVEKTKAVVFYPKDVEEEFVQSMAQYIKQDVSESMFAAENVKVDFRQSETGGYLFLWFDAMDEQGTLLKTYSGICEMDTHEKVSFDDLVQDSFYDAASSELRYQIKASGVLGDEAYTSEFYEKTAPDMLKDAQYFVDEESVFLSYETVLNEQKVILNAEIELSFVANCFEEDEIMYAAGNLVQPVRHYVDPDRPMVALTFDDGPVRDNTLLALELLNAYDAKGTFFMLGFRMERNPDVVLKVLNYGHEAASHTYNHPYLTKKNTNLTYQYTRNQEILSEITNGEVQIKLLRPPYGSFNQKVKETSPYPLVLWSVDTLDWKTLDAQATHDNIMANVQDGDIILLHDLHMSSVESLRTVVPALIDAGYQLVTVSEMMEARGIEMKNGVSYSKARKQTDESE